MFNENGFSPADLAAVVRNEDGSWGGNGGWVWLLIILLFMGGGGYGWNNGNFGAGRSLATTEEVNNGFWQQTNDGMLRSLTYGISDATYALNNAINTGFAANELGRANMQAALTSEINNVNYNQQANACNLNHNITSGFAEANYNLATQACQTRQAVQEGTNKILEAINANVIANKDAKIAEQSQQIFALQLAASQQAQNAYLLNNLQQYDGYARYNNPGTPCCGC